MTPEPLTNALRQVAGALDRLELRYLIGGSVASSSRGVARATMDIDLVVELKPEQAPELTAELGPGWYADENEIRKSIASGRSFNLIHIPTGQKVDVFPAVSAFARSQLDRATWEALAFLGESAEYPVATPEDILLAKLQWYRDGGEVSERQWSDIAGIVAINQSLDRQYLEMWAARLGVAGLLAKALAGTSG